MKTQSVSSYMLANSTRSIIAKAQADLVKAQQEATTGFVYDKGLSLGSRTGQSLSLRKENDRLSAIVDSNGLLTERMTTSQNALGSVLKNSQDFLGTITAMLGSSESHNVAANEAKGLMNTATSLMNTSYNGEYVFAGVNTDVKPIADYEATDGMHDAIQQSFEAHFGFPTTDPQAATISATDMKDYLDTTFAADFDTAWDNASSASDTPIKSRIAPTELVETSVSANSSGFRQAAMSYAMVTEFGNISLNQGAFDAVIHKAIDTTTKANVSLAGTQSILGTAQASTKNATERLGVQIKVLNSSVLDLEAVDPYEAASRVEALKTQIDASYALTVKIQSLSLLNYLK